MFGFSCRKSEYLLSTTILRVVIFLHDAALLCASTSCSSVLERPDTR